MIVKLSSLKNTKELAEKLSLYLCKKDVLLLSGDLGTGKTCFAREVLRSFGVNGEIPSPTFTYVQYYETKKMTIFHFDLYRVEHDSKMEELGFEDALVDGLSIVEWPEKAETYMPKDALSLNFYIDHSNERFVKIKAPLTWKDRLGDFYVGD